MKSKKKPTKTETPLWISPVCFKDPAYAKALAKGLRRNPHNKFVRFTVSRMSTSGGPMHFVTANDNSNETYWVCNEFSEAFFLGASVKHKNSPGLFHLRRVVPLR
jgi:hypothetical protein